MDTRTPSSSGNRFAPMHGDDDFVNRRPSNVDADSRHRMASEVDSRVRNLLASSANVSAADVEAQIHDQIRRAQQEQEENLTISTDEEEESARQQLQEEEEEENQQGVAEELRQMQSERAPVGLDNQKPKCSKKTAIICFSVLGLVVAGGLTAAFLLTGGIDGDDDDNPTAFPSSAPSSAPSFVPTITAAPTREPFLGQFEPLGQVIEGTTTFDRAGSSVSLSSDGTIMAIGAPHFAPLSFNTGGYVRVYQYNSVIDRWIQLGDEIETNPDVLNDEFGVSVSLSGDGLTVCVGAHLNSEGGEDNSGLVRVFQFEESSNDWVQMGQDVYGEANADGFGFSVSMSETGTIWIAGAKRGKNEFGVSSGNARVFQYDEGSSSWVQMGETLNGVAVGDEFGTSVSANSAGDVVAVGGPLHEGNQTNAGHVRVYQYDSVAADWTQKGPDIDGEKTFTFNKFGTSVSLNGDGNIVAAGAIDNSHNGTNLAGHVQVFEFDSTISNWTQLGDDIDGSGSGDGLGYSVSISQDGNVVAAGAWGASDLNPAIGDEYVRVYQFEPTFSWTQIGPDLVPESDGEQFGFSVSISANGTSVVVGARLSNAGGEQSGRAQHYSLAN